MCWVSQSLVVIMSGLNFSSSVLCVFPYEASDKLTQRDGVSSEKSSFFFFFFRFLESFLPSRALV